MKRITIPGFALILAASAIAGCGTGTPSGPGTTASPDQAAVTAALATTPDLIDDGQIESSDVGTVKSSPAPGGALAAIHPFRFWRVVDRIDRRFEFAFSDTDTTGRPTRAEVTVLKAMRGSLVIVAGDSGAGSTDTTRFMVRKPLLDYWVRRLLLVRIPSDSTHRVWKVAGTSAVKVTSALPANEADHAHIQSIQVQSGALDTTITSPLDFFRLRHILRLDAGAQVTLTVTTLRSDDVVVLMARGGRFRLRPLGGNTYSGTWTVPLDGGVRHFGVNALSRGTLWDDAAPYNSQAWLFPYAITGEVLADYRP